ncbi:MAG TPA: hypothetical protein VNY82_02345 [Steroidobacteraceae bacterium]|nr:hypothetical protein [Steroidobacteraceae bacterium]
MSTPDLAVPTATASTRAEGLPRLIYLARILNLCFFPLATVILGNLVILYVSQAQEALRAFDDGPEARWHVTPQSFSFVVAYTMWMMSAWYVARLLVGKRFDPDLVGACHSPQFATFVAKHLPRILALAAGVPIAIFLLRTPQLLGLGVAAGIICVALFVGLVFRRSWARRNGHEWVARWHRKEFEDIERFDDLAGWAKVFIAVLFITSIGIAIALPIWMSPFARWIGAPALLLFALMSWNIFGGLVLTYVPKSWHFPAATWIVVVLLFVSWHWNENHLVAAPAAGIVNAPRQELGAAFVDWLRHRPNPQAPVIFVSSSGGASRAAYWTTSSLGKLEDEARSSSRTFADNIFVISGISGGSLGSAAFVTSLDLVRKSPSGPCSKVRDVANSFTGMDHLSTVVGLMLFPDLVQRYIPKAFAAVDRSRGLEEVWARDWDDIVKKCGGAAASAPNPWQREFTLLYPPGGSGARLPELALSTTALGAGQVVLQDTFTLQRTDAYDILDPRLETKSLTLAQAVHNSARFPYISPAGMVELAKDHSTWDRLGDGGYVEASGALTLEQIIRALADEKLIRAAGTPGACGSGEPSASGTPPSASVIPAGDCYVLWDQVRILILDNAPTYGGNLLCAAPIPGNPSGERREQPQNNMSDAPEPWPPGPDFVAPVLGSFSTRWGRGVTAQVDLRSLVGGCTRHFAELRLPSAQAGSQDPSMDWMLNARSRSDIDSVLNGPSGAQYQQMSNPQIFLKQNMDVVRSWFYPSN